jgi:predicted ATPase
MRLGVSGTHGVGKTTLVEDLGERLGDHRIVPEPFYVLEEEGYHFNTPPSAADYRAQLRRSVLLLSQPDNNIIFDRTPLDFLAYLAVVGSELRREIDAATVRSAFASLDLLVVLPLTAQTERALPKANFLRLRTKVNAALLELLDEDPWVAWRGLPVLELTVPVPRRTETVLANRPPLR